MAENGHEKKPKRKYTWSLEGRTARERIWRDPEFRKRQAEAVKQNWLDPEFRKRQAEAVKANLKERWQDPEFRKRQAGAVKKANKADLPVDLPKGYEKTYRQLVKEVGVERALLIIKKLAEKKALA